MASQAERQCQDTVQRSVRAFAFDFGGESAPAITPETSRAKAASVVVLYENRANVSHVAAIRAFYTANPDEELSCADIMVKFDMTRKQVDNAIQNLRKTGFLEPPRLIRARREAA